MAAFRFSLALLLERRIALETAKKYQLLGAERAASLEGEGVVSLEAQLRTLGNALARDGQSDPSAVRQTLVELELVRSALDARRIAAGSAQVLVRAAREDYGAARREREQLQALHDRAYRAFLAAQDRREENELDEANARGRTLSP